MTHTFSFLPKTMVLLAILLIGWFSQVAMKPATGDTLSVTYPAAGTAHLEWSFQGPVSLSTYIIIVDVIDNRPVASFSSTQSSATVSGLRSGRLYRYTVRNGNSQIVIVDWLP